MICRLGLGKTFTGSEMMVRYGCEINLIVCQKSKVQDWIEHFFGHYIIVGCLSLADFLTFELSELVLDAEDESGTDAEVLGGAVLVEPGLRLFQALGRARR